jgi:hypothetical protein
MNEKSLSQRLGEFARWTLFGIAKPILHPHQQASIALKGGPHGVRVAKLVDRFVSRPLDPSRGNPSGPCREAPGLQ